MYYIHISNSRNYQPTQYYLKLGSNLYILTKFKAIFPFKSGAKVLPKVHILKNRKSNSRIGSKKMPKLTHIDVLTQVLQLRLHAKSPRCLEE